MKKKRVRKEFCRLIKECGEGKENYAVGGVEEKSVVCMVIERAILMGEDEFLRERERICKKYAIGEVYGSIWSTLCSFGEGCSWDREKIKRLSNIVCGYFDNEMYLRGMEMDRIRGGGNELAFLLIVLREEGKRGKMLPGDIFDIILRIPSELFIGNNIENNIRSNIGDISYLCLSLCKSLLVTRDILFDIFLFLDAIYKRKRSFKVLRVIFVIFSLTGIEEKRVFYLEEMRRKWKRSFSLSSSGSLSLSKYFYDFLSLWMDSLSRALLVEVIDEKDILYSVLGNIDLSQLGKSKKVFILERYLIHEHASYSIIEKIQEISYFPFYLIVDAFYSTKTQLLAQEEKYFIKKFYEKNIFSSQDIFSSFWKLLLISKNEQSSLLDHLTEQVISSEIDIKYFTLPNIEISSFFSSLPEEEKEITINRIKNHLQFSKGTQILFFLLKELLSSSNNKILIRSFISLLPKYIESHPLPTLHSIYSLSSFLHSIHPLDATWSKVSHSLIKRIPIYERKKRKEEIKFLTAFSLSSNNKNTKITHYPTQTITQTISVTLSPMSILPIILINQPIPLPPSNPTDAQLLLYIHLVTKYLNLQNTRVPPYTDTIFPLLFPFLCKSSVSQHSPVRSASCALAEAILISIWHTPNSYNKAVSLLNTIFPLILSFPHTSPVLLTFSKYLSFDFVSSYLLPGIHHANSSITSVYKRISLSLINFYNK
ncbi:hypothetical protein NEFER03_0072 [Nematocida sp. LUAm3]|nr:hypothetical protein NEFER03_0072 [Nematocida sp. LUAm3]KAI5173525.1 hypothetical protein NEFER02_0041 [Nematocida sp. LUAm2]KAI5176746.1 hypothetical protein NEFER01_0071 [Nematocida sp. LUAm1]